MYWCLAFALYAFRADFAVVVFLIDKSTQEVPVTWLTDNNTKCWWPTLSKNVSALLKKNIQPDTNTWNKYDVKVDCFCESLKKARKKALDLNCISTDDEALGRGARKKIGIRNHSDASSEVTSSENSMSPPPTLIDSALIEADTPPDTPRSAPIVQTLAESHAPVIMEDLASANIPIIIDNTILQSNIEDKLNLLTRKLNEILFYVKSIDNRLQAIENNPKPKILESKFLEIKEKIPIQTCVDMLNFEQLIKQNEEYKQCFVQYISKVGGKNSKETLQRIFKVVFSNRFATSCSWLGQRGNFGIKPLSSMTLIKDFILTEFPDTKEKDIEVIASEWFRLAKLRLKRESEIDNGDLKHSTEVLVGEDNV